MRSQRLGALYTIVKRAFFDADDLVILVSFARQQHGITLPGGMDGV